MYLEILFNLPVQGSFTYSCEEPPDMALGYRVEAPFRGRKLTGFVIASRSEAPDGDFAVKPVLRILDKQPLFDQSQVDLSSWISKTYFCSQGEALSAMLPGGKRESAAPVLGAYELPGTRDFELSSEQRETVEKIVSRPSGWSYIYGITGSGKTEVFLSVAEITLREGRGVIYLVPEIALTRQLAAEVEERFGKTAAILHSRLTPSQRYAQWMRLLSGDARLVIGARSAVFAPVKNLGLIIVDEEHEGAYKSDSNPRYHARQVAMHRGKQEGARVLMGSATPSLEAWDLCHNSGTGQNGGMEFSFLTKRLSGGSLPEIRVVDMKNQGGSFSRELVDAIRDCRKRGDQAILFLNRRGFTHFFHCRSCGYEMACKNCSVGLTYHKGRNRMICHYCGYSQPPVEVCPECGSLDVGYSGFGTELVEEEIQRTFPDLRVSRMDSDTVQKKGSLEEILEEFRRGDTELLLGTQMVAKGLNFPGVKLVGIVMADTGLNLPDFRASERVFSLITQVSGRAGRYAPDGKVIIQTYKPEHPAIMAAARGELESFYKNELSVRRTLGFPPYKRLFRITFRGKNPETIRREIEALARRLKEKSRENFEVLGPSECPLSVIAGNYRYHLLVRGKNTGYCRGILWEEYPVLQKLPGIYVEIDADPVSLL